MRGISCPFSKPSMTVLQSAPCRPNLYRRCCFTTRHRSCGANPSPPWQLHTSACSSNPGPPRDAAGFFSSSGRTVVPSRTIFRSPGSDARNAYHALLTRSRATTFRQHDFLISDTGGTSCIRSPATKSMFLDARGKAVSNTALRPGKNKTWLLAAQDLCCAANCPAGLAQY